MFVGPPARASSGLATTVVSASAMMVATAGMATPATASCPAGSTMVGGGIFLGPGQAGATYTNGLKINGSEPGDGSSANGDTNPTGWTAFGGFGGASDTDDTVTASAVCATGGPGSTVVEVATAVGTTADPQAGFGPVAATCPSGTSLLSGGAYAVPAADGSLKPIASYPSDGAGNPLGGGAVDAKSWGAFSRNSSAGGPTDGYTPTTTVFALCARATLNTVTAVASTALTTASASVVQSATVSCPAGDPLLSGGVDIDDGNTPPGPSQFGVHLVADDATDGAGNVETGGSVATSWTATAHTGGIAATVGVHTYALCALASAPSTPGTTVPGGSSAASQAVTGPPTGAAATGGTGAGPASASAGSGKGPAGGANTTTTTRAGSSSTTVAGGGPAASSSGGNSKDTIAAPTVPPNLSGQAAAGALARANGGGSNVGVWVVGVGVMLLAIALMAGPKRLVAAVGRVAARGRKPPP